MTDDTTTVYTLVYTLQTAFAGTAGTVSTVSASSVSIEPSPPPEGATGTVVAGSNGDSSVAVTGTVQMDISIVNPPNTRTPNTFYPVGLAVQTASGSTKLPNTGVFSTAVSPTRSTTISLTDVVSGPTTNYDFVVLFQDGSGFFGAMDPLISNNDP
jgi:hypothetical protein